MFVDKKTKLDRLEICKGCSLHRNFMLLKYPKLKWGNRCKACKCFLDAKTSLTKDFFGECPKKKW